MKALETLHRQIGRLERLLDLYAPTTAYERDRRLRAIFALSRARRVARIGTSAAALQREAGALDRIALELAAAESN